MKKEIILLSLLSGVCALSFADDNDQIFNKDNSAKLFQDLPIVIKAGSHTASQNAEHQKYCAQLGAEDVTDSWNFKVGSGVSDIVVCIKANTGDLLGITAGAGPISDDLLQGNIDSGSSLSTSAPNGTVGKGSYWILGTATYSGFPVGAALTMQTGVPWDNCVGTGGGAITSSSGSGYVKTTCSYPSGRYATPSYMNAYLHGASSFANGMIYH